jgi:hypothetical protein
MPWDGQGGWSELNAWSDDWREQDGKGGQDETYFDRGDVGDLVIWSGHGTCGDTNAWAASFTQPNHGGCLCDTGGDGGADYEMHFGERSGDPWNGDGASKWVAMDASCSMMIAEIKEVWYWQPNGIMGRVNQGFGFNASPYDKPDRLEKWANKIAGGKNNVVAWLEAGCETGGCSKNKPAVITKGPDQASAIERSNNANLKNVRYPPPPFWGSYFYWVYY